MLKILNMWDKLFSFLPEYMRIKETNFSYFCTTKSHFLITPLLVDRTYRERIFQSKRYVNMIHCSFESWMRHIYKPFVKNFIFNFCRLISRSDALWNGMQLWYANTVIKIIFCRFFFKKITVLHMALNFNIFLSLIF